MIFRCPVLFRLNDFVVRSQQSFHALFGKRLCVRMSFLFLIKYGKTLRNTKGKKDKMRLFKFKRKQKGNFV